MKVDLAEVVLGWDKALATAAHLLARGSEHAAASGIAEADMLEWRLAPDMFPLRRQIQIICNVAQQWTARAADAAIPPEPSGDSDMAELQQMIGNARAFVGSLNREAFDGRDDVPMTVDLGVINPTMPVGQWVLGFANTNVLFHLSTAYGILRSRGVAIGKADLFAGGL